MPQTTPQLPSPTQPLPAPSSDASTPAFLTNPSGNDDLTNEHPPLDFDAANAAWRIALKRAKYHGDLTPETSHKATPEGEAYRAKIDQINKTQPTQLDAILRRIDTRRTPARTQALSHETACTVVLHIYQAELARRNRSFEFTDDQMEVMEHLTAYFNGDATGPYPLTKGIFLYGDVGVGKTFALNVMAQFCRVTPIEAASFRTVSAPKLITDCVAAKSLLPVSGYINGHLLYDDLGDEKLNITLFGKDEDQRYNPTDTLIKQRYEHFVRAGQLTHFTSNHQLHEAEGTTSAIESRYGTRFYDRISEMTTAILMPGQSKRQ